jgi:hypothetical protein
MTRRTFEIGIWCLLTSCLSVPAFGEGSLTPVQTQATSPAGVLVSTNWSAGTPGVNDPLVFNKFNPDQGTLTSISITLTTTVRNDYEMMFASTSTPTTIYLATSQTSNPSVLADPVARAMLTDGPGVTLFGPNGTSQLFGGAGTRQPVDFVSVTASHGTYSSMLPISSPYYIAPTVTEQSFQRTLTAADSASLFKQFIGTGSLNLNLPISTTAFSSFYSSSGNGGGAVFTEASATVSIQYGFQIAPLSVPEPSSILLLALGAGLVLLGQRCRRRAASLT